MYFQDNTSCFLFVYLFIIDLNELKMKEILAVLAFYLT